jgi:acyl-CoA reductase-like NAD-dependent aldehyde dehydrogenase
MAITQAPQTDTGETFTSRNPVTGEVVGTFALTSARADQQV